MKLTDLQKAIAKIDEDIRTLEAAKAVLVALQRAKPVRKATKKSGTEARGDA